MKLINSSSRAPNASSALAEFINNRISSSVLNNQDGSDDFTTTVYSNGFEWTPYLPSFPGSIQGMYSKIFDNLAPALWPNYQMERMLTPLIMINKTNDFGRKRGYFFPFVKGTLRKIVSRCENYLQIVSEIGDAFTIPLMERNNGFLSINTRTSPHIAISGPTGSGKSTLAESILLALSSLGNQVFLIDPKWDSARITRIDNNITAICPKPTDTTDAYLNRVCQVLSNILKILRKRQQILCLKYPLGTDFAKAGFKQIAIAVDELAAVSNGANRKIVKKFFSLITALSLLSRSSGGELILISQQFNATNVLPSIVRDQLCVRIQLGRLDKRSISFLFPELNGDLLFNPRLDKGSGIISILGGSHNGAIMPFASPFIKFSPVNKVV